jgi:hypothetical protein
MPLLSVLMLSFRVLFIITLSLITLKVIMLSVFALDNIGQHQQPVHLAIKMCILVAPPCNIKND